MAAWQHDGHLASPSSAPHAASSDSRCSHCEPPWLHTNRNQRHFSTSRAVEESIIQSRQSSQSWQQGLRFLSFGSLFLGLSSSPSESLMGLLLSFLSFLSFL